MIRHFGGHVINCCHTSHGCVVWYFPIDITMIRTRPISIFPQHAISKYARLYLVDTFYSPLGTNRCSQSPRPTCWLCKWWCITYKLRRMKLYTQYHHVSLKKTPPHFNFVRNKKPCPFLIQRWVCLMLPGSTASGKTRYCVLQPGIQGDQGGRQVWLVEWRNKG